MSDDQQPASENFLTNKITSMLPLGAAVIAIALGWGEMRSQMAAEQKFREEAIHQLTLELSRIVGGFEKLEVRARVLEEQSARGDERFSMILTVMTELKLQVASMMNDAQE